MRFDDERDGLCFSDDTIVEEIKHMDLERTTLLDALLRLKELQDEIKERD